MSSITRPGGRPTVPATASVLAAPVLASSSGFGRRRVSRIAARVISPLGASSDYAFWPDFGRRRPSERGLVATAVGAGADDASLVPPCRGAGPRRPRPPTPPPPGAGDPWVIVGLGNPGPRYDGTRHNAGFDALDALVAASAGSLAWQPGLRHGARWASGTLPGPAGVGSVPVTLVAPMLFMNTSGGPVDKILGETSGREGGPARPRAARPRAARFPTPPPPSPPPSHLLSHDWSRCVVLLDCLDLSPGEARLRASGGHGGHNGLRDILGRWRPEHGQMARDRREREAAAAAAAAATAAGDDDVGAAAAAPRARPPPRNPRGGGGAGKGRNKGGGASSDGEGKPVPRVRVGIGRPPGGPGLDVSGWVLGRPSGEKRAGESSESERAALARGVARAADLARACVAAGSVERAIGGGGGGGGGRKEGKRSRGSGSESERDGGDRGGVGGDDDDSAPAKAARSGKGRRRGPRTEAAPSPRGALGAALAAGLGGEDR